jgi:hypothetical protein
LAFTSLSIWMHLSFSIQKSRQVTQAGVGRHT